MQVANVYYFCQIQWLVCLNQWNPFRTVFSLYSKKRKYKVLYLGVIFRCYHNIETYRTCYMLYILVGFHSFTRKSIYLYQNRWCYNLQLCKHTFWMLKCFEIVRKINENNYDNTFTKTDFNFLLLDSIKYISEMLALSHAITKVLMISNYLMLATCSDTTHEQNLFNLRVPHYFRLNQKPS